MRKIIFGFIALSIGCLAIWSIFLIKSDKKQNHVVASTYAEKDKVEKIEMKNNEEVKNVDDVEYKEIKKEKSIKAQKEQKIAPVISYNYEAAEKIVDGTYKSDGKKTAFLTFDDGPSSNITPKILDYLKLKNIKATFFVLGKNIEGNEEAKSILKRIAEEGHVIANHTYSHDYKILYPNESTDVKAFMAEIDKTNELIKSAVGQDYSVHLLRMPYGHITRVHSNDKNLAALKAEIKKRGMTSLDWNCLTEDAVGKEKTPDELLAFLKMSAGKKEKLLILMHDSKARNNTYEGLPKIVDYLQSQGYEFSLFNNEADTKK